jgi:3-polyprenyl-4-hydroxybenzoate decarboxylase
MGVIFMSIDKQGAGEGLKAGNTIAKSNPIAKVIIVVDADVNILNPVEVLSAIGARWQPGTASNVIEKAFGLMTDPSQAKYQVTSKIVIDATRQLPEEGGREEFPLSNRQALDAGAPDIWETVEAKFDELVGSWKQV